MAKRLDEFSGLDQLTQSTGAVPMLRTVKLGKLSPLPPATPPKPTIAQQNTPESHNSILGPMKAAQSAPTASPPRALSTLAAQLGPMSSIPKPPSLAASVANASPAVKMAVSQSVAKVATIIAAQQGVSPSHPVVQAAAQAAVQDTMSSSPNPTAAVAAMSDPDQDTSNAAAATAAQAVPSDAVADAIASSNGSTPSGASSNPSPLDSSLGDNNSPQGGGFYSSRQTPQSRGTKQRTRPMAELVNRPDRQYVQPLGFYAAAVAAAATPDVTSKPQGAAFKPTRLTVPSNLAPFFSLLNLRVGTGSQFVGTVEVPCLTFAENAVGVALECDTAQSGIDITLTVKNVDTVAHDFRASMIGVVFK